MFKFLPATEKEWDIQEVEKATPGWLKVVMILFVMFVIMGAIWFDWAHACEPPGPCIAPPITSDDVVVVEMDDLQFKMMKLQYQLQGLRYDTENLIIDECRLEHNPKYVHMRGEFYYCALSNMYAMNRTLRHYNDLFDEFRHGDGRSVEDIGEDFETLNMLFEQFKTDEYFGGWNWYAVYTQYEEYLDEKYEKTQPESSIQKPEEVVFSETDKLSCALD